MKKILFILSVLFLTGMVHSQDCGNPSRYLEDIVSGITMNTVTYGSNINEAGFLQSLEMDIYQPAGDTAALRPAIVLAHGGSYIFGDKQDMAELCKFFARKGYVAATIEYRLWPILFGFPDSSDVLKVVVQSLGDMKAAVRHLRLNASTTNDYRINPDQIFVGGISAGAITALHGTYLTADDDLPAFIEPLVVDNGGLNGNTGDSLNQSFPSTVFGCLNLSGGLYKAQWLNAGEPPVFSMHGTDDKVVPYDYGLANGLVTIEGSKRVHERALEVNVDNYLITVPGGGHTDIYTEAKFSSWVTEFYQNTLVKMKVMICPNFNATRDIPEPETVSAYPVPSREEVGFPTVSESGWQRLEVYDQQGRLVLNKTLGSGSAGLLKSETGAGIFTVIFHGPDPFSPKGLARVIFID